MTVAELITKLQQMHADLDVVIESSGFDVPVEDVVVDGIPNTSPRTGEVVSRDRQQVRLTHLRDDEYVALNISTGPNGRPQMRFK